MVERLDTTEAEGSLISYPGDPNAADASWEFAVDDDSAFALSKPNANTSTAPVIDEETINAQILDALNP